MDEQRLQEIGEGNVPEQRAIDELVAEARRVLEKCKASSFLGAALRAEIAAVLAQDGGQS